MKTPEWDFPVALIPVPNSQGYHLVRTDINEVISFVTSSYNLITHKEAIEMVQKQFKKHGVSLQQSRYNLFGTAKTSLSITYYTGQKVIIAKDDYRLGITITNGYDRLTKLSLAYGVTRQVCSNGAVATDNSYTMKVRHMGDTIESIESFLAKGEEYVKRTSKDFQRMLRTKPVLEPVVVTKREYEEMEELGLFDRYFGDIGKNMYAEFQAYSDYFSNHLTGNKKYNYERKILPNFIALING